MIVDKRSNPGPSHGIYSSNGTQAGGTHFLNNTIDGFGRAGISIDQGVANTIVINNNIYGNLIYNSQYGIEHAQRTNANSLGWLCFNNAFGAITSAQVSGITENFNPVTLTGDPFVDRTDYELNTTSGAGALVRGLRGLPDSKDQTSSTRKSFPSFGAIQPELGGGAAPIISVF